MNLDELKGEVFKDKSKLKQELKQKCLNGEIAWEEYEKQLNELMEFKFN